MIRELIEEQENKILSLAATKSKNAKRDKSEPLDEIKTCFMVDRDKIINCKAFKRLQGKTQVFILPENDHFENRLSHTLKASQVAKTIAMALGLNDTLAETIMLGHDLGHTPFGHAGEEALKNLYSKGFEHSYYVKRRVEELETYNGKKGLNLTNEVMDGMLHHSKLDNIILGANTLEGKIAPFADKMSYLVNDANNAIKAGIIKDVPLTIKSELGNSKIAMLNTMIKNIANNSSDTGIHMSNKMFEIVSEFKTFMFKKVYFSKTCRKEALKGIAIIEQLYEYLYQNKEEIPDDYISKDIEENIVDYIASMTDSYCIKLFTKYFLL